MSFPASLAENVKDGLARGEGDRETGIAYVVVERNPHGVQDGRVYVLGVDGIALRVRPDLVGLAVDRSASNPATGDDGGKH